jgi:glycosyltransferase involved in cell wall biosynthesis
MGGGNINRLGWDQIRPLREYDGVFLIDYPGMRTALARPEIAPQLLAHPKVLVTLDAIWEDVSWVPAIATTSAWSHEDFRLRYPNKPVFLAPWGVAPIDPALPSPWADVRPRLVYLGLVLPRYLDVLNWLAETYEVWIGGLFRPNAEAQRGGLTDAERAEQAPKLKFLSDILPGHPLWCGNGPVIYGSYWSALNHASLGLNFSVAPRYSAVNCKILEYLGAGLPVVSEVGGPNASDILTLGAGQVVPQGDRDALARAIELELATQRDRGRIREDARRMASWPASAEIIHQYFEG